jgi:hypothetical protein
MSKSIENSLAWRRSVINLASPGVYEISISNAVSASGRRSLEAGRAAQIGSGY